MTNGEWNKTMLTTGEAARLLNVHISTVRRWSDLGIIKTYRVSTRGDRKFDRGDIARQFIEMTVEIGNQTKIKKQ